MVSPRCLVGASVSAGDETVLSHPSRVHAPAPLSQCDTFIMADAVRSLAVARRARRGAAHVPRPDRRSSPPTLALAPQPLATPLSPEKRALSQHCGRRQRRSRTRACRRTRTARPQRRVGYSSRRTSSSPPSPSTSSRSRTWCAAARRRTTTPPRRTATRRAAADFARRASNRRPASPHPASELQAGRVPRREGALHRAPSDGAERIAERDRRTSG